MKNKKILLEQRLDYVDLVNNTRFFRNLNSILAKGYEITYQTLQECRLKVQGPNGLMFYTLRFDPTARPERGGIAQPNPGGGGRTQPPPPSKPVTGGGGNPKKIKPVIGGGKQKPKNTNQGGYYPEF